MNYVLEILDMCGVKKEIGRYWTLAAAVYEMWALDASTFSQARIREVK